MAETTTKRLHFPHLTDQDSVRTEAARDHEGLDDAAAMIQQAAATPSRSRNVQAALGRKVNPTETAKVQEDLSLAQEKVDAAFGEGVYRVVAAAVRGDALSLIVEDQAGRTHHEAIGWNDRWRSLDTDLDAAAAQANAEAEAAKGRLGREAMAEVERRVAKARAEILAEVNDLLADRLEEVDRIRKERSADIEAAAESDGDDEAAGGDGSDGDVAYPKQHDALDKLLADSGKEKPEGWDDRDEFKTADKIRWLSENGVEPEAE